LDEYKITQLQNSGSCIDAFGVGTKMGTSADRPYLDVIYKLCETLNADGVFFPIMKLSKDKNTLPGRKQVYRFKSRDGKFSKDVIALVDERVEGEGLLVKVMENGRLSHVFPSLEQIRAVALENLSKLPAEYKTLTNAPMYPVELSQKLQNLVETLKRELTEKEINNEVS
jgi:nicotinate phosphoribosyltransferase